MTKKEIDKMLDDMIGHLKSIKEDVAHGASLEFLTHQGEDLTGFSVKASVELRLIGNRLLYLSDKVCDQTIIKDFE